MKYLDRNDKKLLAVENYKQILEKESHHDHKIVIDDHGVWRWEKDEIVDDLAESISLNYLCPLLVKLGYDKNSEIYRKLYRSIGYSLSGYWEVFYWKVNNSKCNEYRNNEELELAEMAYDIACEYDYCVYSDSDDVDDIVEDLNFNKEKVIKACDKYAGNTPLNMENIIGELKRKQK